MLSVVIIATDNEQGPVLRALVDGTGVARTIHICSRFPVAGVRTANPEAILVDIPDDNPTRALRAIALLHEKMPVDASDPVIRGVRAANPDVILVDIPADNPAQALRAIELLRQEMPDAAIFAIGNLSWPHVIVGAMRAGASEFIESRTTATAGALLEAFVRRAQRGLTRNEPDDADNAPVGAPLEPKPHLRSGGAMAVPESDDPADLAKTPFCQPRPPQMPKDSNA